MAVKSSPTIGVTGPDRGGFPPWRFTAAALRRHGATAVRLSPGRARPEAPLDGLVLGGGSDVDPRLYGARRLEAPSRQEARRRSRLGWLRRLLGLPWRLLKGMFRIGALPLDPPRDAFELELLTDAHERGLPVLGICRGSQLINTFFGGTLHQDLKAADLAPTRFDSVLPRRPVQILAGSRLRRVLGIERCRVNSLHNQAVDRPGDDLEIVARDDDGVVQAIEHREHPFLIGVQWHPEYLPQKRVQRRLFAALVHSAVATHGGER